MSKDTEKAGSCPESSGIGAEVPTIPGCLAESERLLHAACNYAGLALVLATDAGVKSPVSVSEIEEIFTSMQHLSRGFAGVLKQLSAKEPVKEKGVSNA